MVLACHIALTNSVYLQAHHATLLHTLPTCWIFALNLPIFPKISAAGPSWNMKGSWAALAHTELDPDPSAERLLVPQHWCQIWVFSDWRAGLHWKQLVEEHTTPCSASWAQQHHERKERERGRERESGTWGKKRAVTAHPLFCAKCWKLFINMPL